MPNEKHTYQTVVQQTSVGKGDGKIYHSENNNNTSSIRFQRNCEPSFVVKTLSPKVHPRSTRSDDTADNRRAGSDQVSSCYHLSPPCRFPVASRVIPVGSNDQSLPSPPGAIHRGGGQQQPSRRRQPALCQRCQRGARPNRAVSNRDSYVSATHGHAPPPFRCVRILVSAHQLCLRFG
ncbi:putative papain-like cysteine prorease [Anopheles sinensis]|uniref:Putative papain-like cysteine prorease n=1 Tax=Anopheles sinensis TaxID=74873 RepID=A0A084VRW5_ANOSI|nr:putative papain-like cysteine prorease [Anopheles sinensis]